MVAAQAGVVLVSRILEKGMKPGHTVTKLNGAFTPEEPWKRTVPLTRAAAELDSLPQSAWQWVDAGVWRFSHRE